MQPVQGYLCMMVLLQGVGCNLCFACVSFFIGFKSIKRSMHNVGCIGCVTISTRTGVYEFRSVTCIKGYVFSLQTTHILFCQRAWYCCVRLSLLWAGTSFVCGKPNFLYYFRNYRKYMRLNENACKGFDS